MPNGQPMPQPLFAEPSFNENLDTPDPTGFATPHADDTKLYQTLKDALLKNVVGFDKSRGELSDLFSFESALGSRGPDIVGKLNAAGRIVFHAIGDSGCSNPGKYSNEIGVTDQITEDVNTSDPADRPAFLFHLGDVVYDFGEADYYYDQFYEPFRNYPRPIFGIAGNHDSFVVPGRPGDTPLTVFTRNFCAESPVITNEARSLHRTAMTQPGVYYALDAPFVRIICLFSNALEDPGVISNTGGDQGGPWPNVDDTQLKFLEAQLTKVKTDNYPGAVLLAVHHPPFSYAPPPDSQSGGGNHGSSSDMLREIDTICNSVGVYPHAFLSAHAHNYQHFTRHISFLGKDYDVPFVVCGNGGHNVNPLVKPRHGFPAQDPKFQTPVDYLEANPAITSKSVILEKFDDVNYGYMRIAVDPQKLQIAYHQAGGPLNQSQFELVTVDLASHRVVAI